MNFDAIQFLGKVPERWAFKDPLVNSFGYCFFRPFYSFIQQIHCATSCGPCTIVGAGIHSRPDLDVEPIHGLITDLLLYVVGEGRNEFLNWLARSLVE